MARILIVEDNPANLSLMEYLLKAFGHDVTSTTDGAAGVAAAERELPDVILMDLQMPTVNGYEATARIKAQPRLAHVPVIAVTAFAMVGDRDRILSRGFDGYIGKPITPETFVNDVERFLAKGAAKQGAVPQATSPIASSEIASPTRATGRLILVVDNSPVNLQLALSTFAPFGYEVHAANSVAEALEWLRTRTPDLILSDVHMPGADGYDFLRLVRADDRFRTIPFVFISSTVWGEVERNQGLGRGADDVILRPIEPAALVARIEKHFRST